jgi:hypothetical protein
MARTAQVVHLERDEDVSGVSGTGVVAYGLMCDDGTVLLHWDTVVKSDVVYRSVADLMTIVGHGGRTRLVVDRTVRIGCAPAGEAERARSR